MIVGIFGVSVMAEDISYENLDYRGSEVEHGYGPNVHILSDPAAVTQLARLCAPEVIQPEFNRIVRRLYRELIVSVINETFPKKSGSTETRMRSETERGVYEGVLLDPDVRAVTVDVARAGIIPSDVCYTYLNELFDPRRIRQDHLVLSRNVDKSTGSVEIEASTQKIGGAIDDSFVIFPDPMGATGNSLDHAISFYKERVDGEAEKMVTANLMVTPEFIGRITQKHPDVEIFTLRLDRGMSDEEVLQSPPGTHWERESGLTDDKYIVPGGGGFGELMNNAWD